MSDPEPRGHEGAHALSLKWVFGSVALLAFVAGAALWLGSGRPDPVSASEVAPATLYAATFLDAEGRPQALGRYQGKILVLNFWATWCAPCRQEMPAFSKLQKQWKGRGVQFVGIANDDPRHVSRFGKELGIEYPLLTGGEEVNLLSKRLGNRTAVLPHTVIFDRDGRVLEEQVGPYSEAILGEKLAKYAGI